jgi:hypothetical protein
MMQMGVLAAGCRSGDARGGLVFGHIARLKPGNGDFGNACFLQLRQIFERQKAPFAE